MIETIKSEEEIQRLIKICGNDPEGKILSCARFTLPHKQIKKWIEEGNFKHLKNELSIYNNIKFGCLKNEYGCIYFFFGNKEATYRILNLISKLMENKQAYLKDCKSNSEWENSKYNTDTFISGEFNACPLF